MATNKEIIENAYASFATGDIPAALGAMADDIEWTEADGFPLAGTYVGPQGVLEGVFMRLGEIGDGFAVVPEEFVGRRRQSRGARELLVEAQELWRAGRREDGLRRVDHERGQSCSPSNSTSRRHRQGPRAQLTHARLCCVIRASVRQAAAPTAAVSSVDTSLGPAEMNTALTIAPSASSPAPTAKATANPCTTPAWVAATPWERM